MGTKRKAEEQDVFEIESDEEGEVREGVPRNDGGSDSDVEIQEKSIPVVNVDDDEEMDTAAKEPPDEPDSPEAFIGPAPRGEGLSEESKQAVTMEGCSDKLLLSMTFRDAELFQLFKGSLTEYLKTTFQLKLAGQEVDVLHQVESCSIQILSKQPLPAKEPESGPTVCPPATPTPKDDPPAMVAEDDGMFVIDSTPAKTAKGGPIVPSYKKALQKVLDNSPSAVSDSATKRPKPRQLCWNCDGDHGLRDCKEPRNFAKISKMKQEHMKKMDRYHVDLEQKYGHIVPGRLSDELRQALGLKKRDLPVHIYRMRLYGYPPGWLEEAKVTHSGLQLFDSRGAPVQDSDESDGEVDNVKHKFDVRKIISYPGFNVPAGTEYYDDSKFFGVPPLQEHQSRERMIQSLEGSLVQGYRRKKLRLSGVGASEGPQAAADMELDAPDEGSFTTVDSVGECDSLKAGGVNGAAVVATAENRPADEEPEEGEVDEDGDELKRPEEAVQGEEVQLNGKVEDGGPDKNDTSMNDSLILVEPEEPEIICLDDTRPPSPSLEDLRLQQQQLLQALEDQSPAVKRRKKGPSLDSAKSPEDSLLEDVLEVERLAEEQQQDDEPAQPAAFVPFVFPAPPLPPSSEPTPPQERPPEPEFLNLDEIKMSKTPFIDDPASMGLKTMSLGTPILTAFSPFNTLPCGDAFSRGVSDVINFENLPNSTGKYERMKSLLSKVRTVIHAHNGELDEEEQEDGEDQDQDSR